MTLSSLRLLAEDLACVRGGRPVFDAVSFEVGSGEALLVTGRNGAGKSSLLRLVAGLVPRASGELSLQGGDPDRSIGEQLHYAGHADALKPVLSVLENLAFWATFYGEDGLAPRDALERLGIEHLADLPAGYLSAGQRHRLALARLLVSRRPIWLLDEPTSTLDHAAQTGFAGLVLDHLAEGGMMIAATHADLGIGAQRRLEIGG